MINNPILQPVVVLIAWSLVMLVWMFAVRIPALKKAGIDMSKVVGGKPGALDGIVADKAQWPAHNYIHLMEQPTLFYAVSLTLALAGPGGGWDVIIAWGYVALRIVHSLIQATFNKVDIRFLVFILATLCLAALTLQAVIAVFALHH